MGLLMSTGRRSSRSSRSAASNWTCYVVCLSLTLGLVCFWLFLAKLCLSVTHCYMMQSHHAIHLDIYLPKQSIWPSTKSGAVSVYSMFDHTTTNLIIKCILKCFVDHKEKDHVRPWSDIVVSIVLFVSHHAFNKLDLFYTTTWIVAL